MKSTYFKILSLSSVLICAASCERDMQSEINGGKWNHERQVIDIKFDNQIGNAEIDNFDASTGYIDISINVDVVPDLSEIRIASLQLSYQATASANVGDALDFENADRSASLTVKSVTGETRTYIIHVKEFTETILGKWAVDGLYLYGGTGPEYGGGAVLALADKPWCWNESTGPSAECDNTLTFNLEGVTDDGNTYGTCVNDAGPDGKYFDALYVGNNPETGQNVDVSGFYRQVPEGKSSWLRDYASGTIIFTDAEGKTTTGSFVGAGTEDLGYDHSFTVSDHALAFSLNGTDDWDNIYGDYDKFVKKARKYWITLKKIGSAD